MYLIALISCDPVRMMTSLTSEEVDGNGDPCARAYAGGWTLGCGHGYRPEVGHGDRNQVNLIFLPRTVYLKEMVKNILTSQNDREAPLAPGTRYSHR